MANIKKTLCFVAVCVQVGSMFASRLTPEVYERYKPYISDEAQPCSQLQELEQRQTCIEARQFMNAIFQEEAAKHSADKSIFTKSSVYKSVKYGACATAFISLLTGNILLATISGLTAFGCKYAEKCLQEA